MLDKAHIEKIKTLSIQAYLASLGYVPAKQIGSQLVYISPLTHEHSPSFFVHPDKNVFNCFSSGEKGDIITLVRHLEKIDFKQAMLRLQQITSTIPLLMPLQQPFQSFREIDILKVKELTNRILGNYLLSRGISTTLGKQYLQEIYFRVQEKQLFALGLANDKGGYELRNPFYKGCAIAKAATTISGASSAPTGAVNLFEGMFDFLSALSFFKTNVFKNDSIILSSLWIMDKSFCMNLLDKYDTFHLFLDNDRAGWKKAIEFKRILKDRGQLHRFQNHSSIYKTYKDFNAFLLA